MNDSLTPQPPPVPHPLADVLSAAEEYCVCGCCGMDALNLDADVTSAWIASEGMPNARLALQQMRDLVAQLKSCNYGSGIQHSWNGPVPEELAIALEVIESNLEVNIPR